MTTVLVSSPDDYIGTASGFVKRKRVNLHSISEVEEAAGSGSCKKRNYSVSQGGVVKTTKRFVNSHGCGIPRVVVVESGAERNFEFCRNAEIDLESTRHNP